MRALRVITLGWLAIFAPIETYLSRSALLNGNYTVDLASMIMMAVGVWMAFGRRRGAAAVLAAGWAWETASFWRGTTTRFDRLAAGLPVEGGSIGPWVGVALTVLMTACVVWALVIAARESPPNPEA